MAKRDRERHILERLGLTGPGAVDRSIEGQLREAGETPSRERADRTYVAGLAMSPPACIGRCGVAADKAACAAAVRAYGPMITVFAIQPRSRSKGSAPLPVWGVPADNPPLTDPIYVGAPDADAAVFGFDSRKHGYDGELRHAERRQAGTPKPHRCPKCGHDRFRLMAVFQYSGDNEELENPDDLAHMQDFFSWFFLIARCGKCEAYGELASIECA